MLNEILSSILQILFFSLIPFLFYSIKNKKAKGFFDYIGLKKSTPKAIYLSLLACLVSVIPIILLILVNPDFKALMTAESTVIHSLKNMGFNGTSLATLLIVAIFKTAFAEEIFFRGFIAKRLIKWLGYQKGNLLQAAIFAAIHSILFITLTHNVFLLFFVFLMPFIMAYLCVYLNEKLGSGSIIPGWITHALANTISYITFSFVVT